MRAVPVRDTGQRRRQGDVERIEREAERAQPQPARGLVGGAVPRGVAGPGRVWHRVPGHAQVLTATLVGPQVDHQVLGGHPDLDRAVEHEGGPVGASLEQVPTGHHDLGALVVEQPWHESRVAAQPA